MQINYDFYDARRSTSPGFWYPPSTANTIQEQNVPVLYAPYGAPGYWQNETASRFKGSQNAVLNKRAQSLAPNTATANNVLSSAIAAGFAGLGADSPAASAIAAGVTGQALGPLSLVAPMPSITRSPSATQVVTCNPVDSWVSSNPMLAGLAVIGAFLFFGGRR